MLPLSIYIILGASKAQPALTLHGTLSKTIEARKPTSVIKQDENLTGDLEN